MSNFAFDALELEIKTYANRFFIPIITEDSRGHLINALEKVMKNRSNKINVLELGSAIGYSALIMANILDANGRDYSIITIEKAKKIAEQAKIFIAKSDYRDRIRLIEGDALKESINLDESGFKADFVFIDAAKAHYEEYFRQIDKMTEVKAIIFSDNVLFRGLVNNGEKPKGRKKTIIKRMRQFLAYARSLDYFEHELIEAGDGILISTKNESKK